MFVIATLVAVGLLSAVHVVVGRLRFLDKNPEVWKSVAGGVGIGYAFLVLLPKLAAAQDVLQEATGTGLYSFLQHHSYLLALVGLLTYYGTDVAMENVLVLPDSRALRPVVRLLVYAHACSLSGYYFLVSYVMSEVRDVGFGGYVSLGLFALAMVLHYLTIDYSLRQKYGGLYDLRLRWGFVAASLGGWALATGTEIPYAGLALLNSLFVGVLIVFTLREKTPISGQVYFTPFLAGVMGYSLLLLVIEALES